MNRASPPFNYLLGLLQKNQKQVAAITSAKRETLVTVSLEAYFQ
jgi:hypothetical protein